MSSKGMVPVMVRIPERETADLILPFVLLCYCSIFEGLTVKSQCHNNLLHIIYAWLLQRVNLSDVRHKHHYHPVLCQQVQSASLLCGESINIETCASEVFKSQMSICQDFWASYLMCVTLQEMVSATWKTQVGILTCDTYFISVNVCGLSLKAEETFTL